MEKIILTEEQIRSIVEDTVRSVINESEMDEGFLDNIKAAVKGASNAYKSNRALSNDNTDFQRGGRRKVDDGIFGDKSLSRADAIVGKDGIRDLEQLSRQYAAKGRELWNKAQRLKKYFGVEKSEYEVNGEKRTAYNYSGPMGGVPDTSGMKRKTGNNPTPQASGYFFDKPATR